MKALIERTAERIAFTASCEVNPHYSIRIEAASNGYIYVVVGDEDVLIGVSPTSSDITTLRAFLEELNELGWMEKDE